MSEFAARLLKVDSCAVSDAIDRLKAGGGPALGLLPVTVAGRIAGPVRTVKLGPADGSPPRVHLGARLLDVLCEGEVIVIANEGRMDTACFGGTLARGARRAGAAGVILDGGCRDVEEAAELGVRIFGRGTVLRAARGRIMEEAQDGDVTVAGVEIRSGDWVIADSSGVVFIRREDLASVIEAAEAIVDHEQAMANAIEAGMPMQEVMGASYEALTRPQQAEA